MDIDAMYSNLDVHDELIKLNDEEIEKLLDYFEPSWENLSNIMKSLIQTSGSSR